MSPLTSRTRTPMVGGGLFFGSAGFDSAVIDLVAGARISVIRRLSYDQGFGDFHLPVFEGVDECVDYGGIEVCSGTGDDDLPGFKWGDGAAIGAIAGQSVKGI